MTAQQPPDPAASGTTTGEPANRRRIRLACAVVSGTILVAGHLVTLFFTGFGWLMQPEGPGDFNHMDGAWYLGFTGTLLSLCTALLTWIPLRAHWLSRRWLIVPAVLFVAATTRWVYLDLAYDWPRS